MDELTFVRNLGSVETAASPAERERVRAALLAHIERSSRPRAVQRRWVFALAAGILLLIAGTAVALGPLRDLFEGQPAPPKVKRSIAGFNDFHEDLLRMGLGGFVVRSEDATGLIEFRAGKLRMRVWTAPLVDGGSCTFVDAEGARYLSIGPCTAPVNAQPPVLYGLSQSASFGLVLGHVTDHVARLDIRLGSGRVRHLPLVKGFFATGFASGNAFADREHREVNALIAHQRRETRRGTLPAKKLNAHHAAEWRALERRQKARRAAARPSALVSYDAAGRRVATLALPSDPPESIPFPLVFFYKGMRALLQINTPSGAPAALIHKESDGKICEAIWYGAGAGVTCGAPVELPGDSELSLGGWQGTSAAPGRWLQVGTVGNAAATVEIRYGNGRRQQLELLEGRFLVELSDEQLAHRPELVARDASGQVIRTRTLVPPRRP
jgi:hypothetical protein